MLATFIEKTMKHRYHDIKLPPTVKVFEENALELLKDQHDAKLIEARAFLQSKGIDDVKSLINLKGKNGKRNKRCVVKANT